MPSDVIPLHYTTEFSKNWESRVQQTKSRLDPWIETISFTGERKRFDRVDKSTSQRRVERKAPTPVSNATSDSRWAFRESFEIPAKLLDVDDAMNLGNLTLPNSQYVMDNTSAYNRDIDDLACSIAIRPVFTGQNGTDSFSLPTSQAIAHGGTGLTLDKLIQASEIMLAAEVDPETPRVLVISVQQMTNLLKTTEIKNADYNTIRALVAGTVKSFMGFEFVVNNRLPKSGTTRTCVAWTRGSVKMIRGTMHTMIDKRPDLSYATQIYSQYNLGGTRVHDEGVVKIECTEV